MTYSAAFSAALYILLGVSRMTKKTLRRAAGAGAGVVNGLFGGGGGMVLLPILTKWGGIAPRSVFATCVAAVYPMCIISATLYCLRVRPALSVLLPCILGGVVGGIVSGLTFEKVPVRILKLIFGAFLLYGAVRYLR